MPNIKEGDIQLSIRMPETLWNDIKSYAEDHYRSANAQMLLWLFRGVKEDRENESKSNVL